MQPADARAHGRDMVWLVEPGPSPAELVRAPLLTDYDVDVLADGESVLGRLGRGAAPDVLIVDEHLPETRAVELCRRVREGRDPVALPILALVEHPTKRDVVELLEAGANDCLGMPYDDEELHARVDALVHLRRKWEEMEAERDRLGMATEASGVGTWDFYPLTGETFWDGRVKELLGVPHEVEGSYETFLAAVHPDDREATHQAVQRALDPEGTGKYRIQCRLIGIQDRVERWLATRGRAFFEDGRPVRFIGTCVDITQQKRAEHALDLLARAGATLAEPTEHEVRAKVAASLCVEELADLCIIDIVEDPDRLRIGAVAHVDPEKEDLVRALRERYPPDPARHPVFAVLRSGAPRFEPVIDPTRLDPCVEDEGHCRIVAELSVGSLIIVPLRARERTLGALSLGRRQSRMPFDQVDLQVAEEVARRAAMAFDNALLREAESRARAAAEAASRAKDDFLATVSHELRTPLTSVLGWTRMLMAGAVPPDKQRRAFETIHRNTRAQAQLIEALLDFSCIAAGKLRLDEVPVRIAAPIEAAIAWGRPAAEAKGVTLKTQIDPDTGEIRGDAGRIEQIVMHLLGNAIKFTPRGGEVTVTLRPDPPEVEMVVSDNGVGIPADFLPFVFDHFRQADSSVTRAFGGLGLGLAIVKHLVERHGGRVEARSPGPGRGATFVVRLPLARG